MVISGRYLYFPNALFSTDFVEFWMFSLDIAHNFQMANINKKVTTKLNSY